MGGFYLLYPPNSFGWAQTNHGDVSDVSDVANGISNYRPDRNKAARFLTFQKIFTATSFAY